MTASNEVWPRAVADVDVDEESKQSIESESNSLNGSQILAPGTKTVGTTKQAAATTIATAVANDTESKRNELRAVLKNLKDVETALRSVVGSHKDGNYGFLTREWGFTAPGGLGPPLMGKFRPWEDKLRACKDFFWPIQCYEAMEVGPDFGKPDPEMVKFLPPEGEQLYGNTPLHYFLEIPPHQAVDLTKEDYRDYRSAARIFLLLGTMSHLHGNSAPKGPKTTPLPRWIEDPMVEVAERLGIEPTLSGHFLVYENWQWKDDAEESAPEDTTAEHSPASRKSSVVLNRRRLSKHMSVETEKTLVGALLRDCECEDRVHRITVYPDCFLGSQCVDVVLAHDYANTREDAVRLLRKVNKSFKLFSHVKQNNYELIDDDRFFYHFRKEWNTRRFMALNGNLEDSRIRESNDTRVSSSSAGRPYATVEPAEPVKPSSSRSNHSDMDREETLKSTSSSMNPAMVARLSTSYNPARITPNQHKSVYDTISIVNVMAKVTVRDRWQRLHKHRKCFVGKELIDVLQNHGCASTRMGCLELAMSMNQRLRLFEHVKDQHLLKDKNYFYRFTETFRNLTEDQTHASTLVDTGGRKQADGERHVSFSQELTINEEPSVRFMLDNTSSQRSYSDYGENYDSVLGLDEETEFRLDNITMLYPAFGNNHERINQLVPACMAFSLSSLPFDVLDILSAMRNVVEAELNAADGEVNYEIDRLYDLVYKVAFSVSKCKEEFQLMSTDPHKRTLNSKYVSIKQTQPLSNGTLVRRKKGEEPKPAKGTTGTQFPYFHILDWLLGRYHYKSEDVGDSPGLVAAVGSIDDTFPIPQREYIRSLSKLDESSSLRGFLEIIGRPTELLTAYNHLIECYAGDGGVLQAHCRKLYSYIHNNVQSSTSGTNHLATAEKEDEKDEASRCPMSSNDKSSSKCPMSSNDKSSSGCPMALSSNDSLDAIANHDFATMMFKHMREAADARWRLRLPPLMNEVGKVIYSTSESGGFTTVALELSGTGLLYEYGDVVKVILPNDDKQTRSWVYSLKSMKKEYFKLDDMIKLQRNTDYGWGWDGLWEALGLNRFEENGGSGVPLETIARYIEQGNIRDKKSNKRRWVHSPLDLSTRGNLKTFAAPPPIPEERIASLEPVSPRIYSVSGVETERVFLLVSKPDDHARHHGYSSMSDPSITRVHCSFSPATFFLVPPKEVNLVCIATGTGISPFVGLVDSIASREGSYTIVHQCKSSDMFMCNSQTWLDFTAMNPGSIVMGYISGDRSRRNCPMRYIIRNGVFEETVVLRRKRISAYYFECDQFKSRIVETYKSDGLNLAYCCGGARSAIIPLETFAESRGMKFEFSSETYGIPPTLVKGSTLSNQIGGSIIDLSHISPIHPGGDQILHQANNIMTDIARLENKNSDTPDLSKTFYELHPHAYNLHRCLRTPGDADSKAFAKFLERKAFSKSVLGNMATKYAQAALSSPESSNILKIATELQSSALSAQMGSGDTEGAERTASYLKELLNHVDDEDDVARWGQTLDLVPRSRRKSNVVLRAIEF